jgi:hypothetical protein
MLHFTIPKEYILIICFQVCIKHTELSIKMQPLSWAANDSLHDTDSYTIPNPIRMKHVHNQNKESLMEQNTALC